MSDGPGAAGEGGAAPAGWPSPRSRAQPAREAEILAAWRAGQRTAAIDLLVKIYGAPLRGFALRMVRDREAADDVCQQALLEAFRGLDRFEGRSTVWSWLCGIVCHRALDEVRRRRRHDAHVADSAGVLDGMLDTPDPAMDAARREQRQALERCLGKLPAKMRAQVLMRHWLGLSHVEIGALFDEPHGTVQVRLSRILPRLRVCLRDEGVRR